MELSSSNIKKILIFSEKKAFLLFSQKKLFLYFLKRNLFFYFLMFYEAESPSSPLPPKKIIFEEIETLKNFLYLKKNVNFKPKLEKNKFRPEKILIFQEL